MSNLAGSAERLGELDEALVEGEVVPHRVLPALVGTAEKRKLGLKKDYYNFFGDNNSLISYYQRIFEYTLVITTLTDRQGILDRLSYGYFKKTKKRRRPCWRCIWWTTDLEGTGKDLMM